MSVPDINDPRPAYVQIAADLREQVSDGTYPPGTRLPPQRELCQRYGVAGATIGSALAELAREGVISSGSTRGTFVLAAPGEPEPSPLAGEVARLRGALTRVELNLADLYGKLGYDYPHEQDGEETADDNRDLA